MGKMKIDELRERVAQALKDNRKNPAAAAGIETIKAGVGLLALNGLSTRKIATALDRSSGYIAAVKSLFIRQLQLPSSGHFNATVSRRANPDPGPARRPLPSVGTNIEPAETTEPLPSLEELHDRLKVFRDYDNRQKLTEYGARVPEDADPDEWLRMLGPNSGEIDLRAALKFVGERHDDSELASDYQERVRLWYQRESLRYWLGERPDDPRPAIARRHAELAKEDVVPVV